MKKILKFLTSKVLIIGLFLLLQLLFLGFIVDKLIKNEMVGIYLQLFFNILSFFIILRIVSSDINPEYKISWIIPVLALPVFGTFFYLLYHQNNVTKKRKRIYNEIITDRNTLLNEIPNELDYKEIKYLNKNGWRYYRNSKINLLNSGEEKLESLIKDLKKAEKFIFLEYFIISKGKMFDKIIDVLIERAQSGVEVKIIYDDFGSANTIPFNFKRRMNSFGIEVVAFNPITFHLNFSMNYRTHRKIVVIDNKIAYTGGINIGDEYANYINRFGHWHDSSVRIEGEAVWSLTLIFLESWNFSNKIKLTYTDYYKEYKVLSDQVIAPFADNPIEDRQITKSALLFLIGEARKEILISSPYLILDNEIVTALKLSAKSGVKVSIVLPKNPDKKLVYLVTESFALDLAKAGVNIYKYTPGFIHAKLYLFDGKKAIVGTSNLDFRSLYLHFENNVLVYNSPFLKEVEDYIIGSINVSELVTVNSLTKKSAIIRILQAIIRGFSAML